MNEINNLPESAHKKIIALVGANKTVLDIGCGKGNIARALSKNECNVTGIDVLKENIFAAWIDCTDVVFGDIETMKLRFEKKKFDVMVLADVLEHLVKPKETLEKLKPFLKKNGYIVISVPNVANWKIRLKLLFGKFDYAEEGIMDKTHLHFFTKKTIKELVDSAGFEILEEEFVPSVPFPFFKKHLAKLSKGLFSFQFVMVVK